MHQRYKIKHQLKLKIYDALYAFRIIDGVRTPRQPIISVHAPKCAGTSFLRWLTTAYPSTPVLTDYDTVSIDRSGESLPDGHRIVHGHFWATKYKTVKNAFRVTFLRHPVERAISHYFYWRSVPLHGNPSHDLFLRENMDILTFATLPETEGLYRNNFFFDTDMDSFDFIGNTASLAEDVAGLERTLGVKGEMPRENTNTWNEYASEKARLLGNSELLIKLTRALDGDIDFFESCMRRRQTIMRNVTNHMPGAV